MYCVLYFTLEKKNISDWPKSGPVETGPTGPVATPLFYCQKYSRELVSVVCSFILCLCLQKTTHTLLRR